LTHTYNIAGMTCNNCVKRVQKALGNMEGIENAAVTLNPPQAVITMKSHIPDSILNKAVQTQGNYVLTETKDIHQHMSANPPIEENKSFLVTYKPILLVFVYLTGITVLNEIFSKNFSSMNAMRVFMGGFFMVFSFFKMLDLRGFAYSYMTYDVIAKRWPGWGFVYPFIELALGLSYLFQFEMTITNITTVVVMGVSSIGVIQSLLAKRQIQCACLGTVFNLPMSTVTITEDLAMTGMAAAMLII
jgi:copper chaperone CopZ